MLSGEAGGIWGPSWDEGEAGNPALPSSNPVSGSHRSFPLPPMSHQFCPEGAWDKHPLMPTQSSSPWPPHLVGLRHLGRPLLHARSHSQTLKRQGGGGGVSKERATGSGQTDGRQAVWRLTWLVGFHTPSSA